jgi:transglutaminase-like putative cysteine protease
VTAKERLARVLPTLAACGALAGCSGFPVPPLVIGLVLMASAALRARAPFDRATQRLFSVVSLMLVIAGVRAADMPVTGPDMRAAPFAAALAPLVVSALRMFVAKPEGGRRVDVLLATIGVLACGTVHPGIAYVGWVFVFVTCTVASAYLIDGAERVAITSVPMRVWGVGALVVALALGGTTAVGLSVVPVARYLNDRFQRAFADRWESRIGFSDTVRFGRITRLLGNRTIVLRLRGPQVERLRGAVLDQYDDERWSRAGSEPMRDQVVSSVKPTGPDVVELHAAHVDGERLFLPFETRDLAAASAVVKVDSMGVFKYPGDRTPLVWFRQGDRDRFPSRPSTDADYQMPRNLRAPLQELAIRWTEGATSPEEALRALDRHLKREFTYSADYRRTQRMDAVAEFLLVAKKGHCEAFASGLALLARSIGIPTRLVAGYRVGERNPVFGHWVVRQSNAHAWVEAEVDGRWITLDPTPMSELPQDAPHDEDGVESASETLAAVWSRVEEWLAERSVLEFAAAAGGGLALFAFLRLRRRPGASVEAGPGALAFRAPLEAYRRLEKALAARGLARERGETLDRWAARVPEAAAAALRRYAELRYSGGDDAIVARDLDEAASAVQRR